MLRIYLIFGIVALSSAFDLFAEISYVHVPQNRFKRGAEFASMCCGEKSEMPDVTSTCMNSTADELKKMDLKDQFMKTVCMFDCLMRENDLISSDNVIDKKKMLDFAAKYDKETYRNEMREKYYDQCASEADEIQKKISSQLECSAKPYVLVGCLMKEIIANCPKDLKPASAKVAAHCKEMEELFKAKLSDAFA